MGKLSAKSRRYFVTVLAVCHSSSTNPIKNDDIEVDIANCSRNVQSNPLPSIRLWYK